MTRTLTIEGHEIGDDSDCFVIAEIGHNHQGNLAQAKQLFDLAKDCGADAVKLQKRENKIVFTHEAYVRPYDNENSFGATYGEHREALEFGMEEYRELKKYAEDLGLVFFATAFDHISADFLAEVGVPAFKIASGDLQNTPLIRHVASFQKPVIVSTGGAEMEHVERAYETVVNQGAPVALLQCTAGYPPSYDELNLRVIQSYREQFDCVVGLSSHDSGIAMSLAAYVLGARILEKHLTLNRAMKGTDHAFSLEHSGMSKLVRDLRRARIALGDGVKRPYPSEVAPLVKMAKKLVAARDLPTGHVITDDDLVAKSPGDGIAPYRIDEVIGRTLRRAVSADEDIALDLLE
jgi:sialic acid synthase